MQLRPSPASCIYRLLRVLSRSASSIVAYGDDDLYPQKESTLHRQHDYSSAISLVPARGAEDKRMRLGSLMDMNGLYADMTRRGSGLNAVIATTDSESQNKAGI